MDEQLLNSALQTLMSDLSSGKAFVLEQAPEVIQQLVMYNLVVHGIGVAVGFLLAFICCLMFRLRLIPENYKYEDEFLIAGCVSGVIALGFLLINVPRFLHAYLAPKAFILEYAAKLIG